MEAKIVEDIEKQMIRKLLWDSKVLGTSADTRAAAAPGQEPAGTCHRILGQGPNQQPPPLLNRDREAPGWTWMLEVTGENKDDVGDTQVRGSPTETVNAGWLITRENGEPGDAWRREKSWAVMDPDPNSLQSGWKVGMCERPGA